jgi:DNA modification methylase
LWPENEVIVAVCREEETEEETGEDFADVIAARIETMLFTPHAVEPDRDDVPAIRQALELVATHREGALQDAPRQDPAADLSDDPDAGPDADPKAARVPLSRHTRKALARIAHCSEDTIRKAEIVRNELPPVLLDRVRSGERSLNAAFADADELRRSAPDLKAQALALLEAGEAPDARIALRLVTRRVWAERAEAERPDPVGWTLEETDTTAHLSDGCAGLILTDPPYGISEPGKLMKQGGVLTPADFDGDDDWDRPDGYLERLDAWVAEWARLVRPGGSVVSFIDGAKLSHLWEAFERHGLKPKRPLVWHKTDPSPASLARRNLISSCEFMVWATKPGADYVFNRDSGWNLHNFFEFPTVRGAERIHPCQKPVELLRRLILLLTERDDLVLDPFAGSGSTGVAACRVGRKSHLIERDPGYCDGARRRLEAETERLEQERLDEALENEDLEDEALDREDPVREDDSDDDTEDPGEDLPLAA